jgi:hypothetical protein
LVSAEIARVDGRHLDAMRLYEEAIRAARENEFIQNEGVALEVAARFYEARGFETTAHAFLQSARNCYLRWGAEGKVRQFERLHPYLREHPVQPSPIGAPAEQLEVGGVIKASQAVSTEIVLDRLIETLMTIALEHAGAQRGLLVLMQGDAPHIEAEATTDQKSVMVTVRQEAVTPAAVPESLLNTVIRLRQSVILDDAWAQNPFSADSYIREKRARSVLCLPLLKQTRLIGVLYLREQPDRVGERPSLRMATDACVVRGDVIEPRRIDDRGPRGIGDMIAARAVAGFAADIPFGHGFGSDS